MGLAQVHSFALNGVQTPNVTVEVHTTTGLPAFSIVGLPETAVRESKDRVRSAILNSGFEFPPRRITVNLAPAELPKEGARFDLAIAIGVLVATEQVQGDKLNRFAFLGELALDGALRGVLGILPTIVQMLNTTLIVPETSADQAGLVESETRLASSLGQVAAFLNGQDSLPLAEIRTQTSSTHTPLPDLSEVRGQHRAKRALEIAACGGHHMLMIGPPGSGKSMLAERLRSILPPMTEAEAIESAAVYSVLGKPIEPSHWKTRPFRSPHHTASGVALVGGGGPNPRPGEISLAHHGVLFLDELPEFDRHALEALREPLEMGRITISRAARQADFPAQFQLIAAMNPSPDGYEAHSPQAIKYRSKLSGPFLDRIDIQIEVPPVPKEYLRADKQTQEESSSNVQQRLLVARTIQINRQGCSNAQLRPQQLLEVCALTKSKADLLEAAVLKLKLSARGQDRVLRVARTIADLTQSDNITQAHLAEAISYRALARLS